MLLKMQRKTTKKKKKRKKERREEESFFKGFPNLRRSKPPISKLTSET
jgi:hypothetical protein